MGGCCSNRSEENFERINKKNKIQQGGIRVYDLCGLIKCEDFSEFCEECQGFRAISVQMLKRRKSKHSLVRLSMHRNDEKVIVSVKFSSKTFFRIEIWPGDEESESEEVSVEFISVFAKDQESGNTLKDFLLWIFKYDGKFDKLMKKEKNMGKVVCDYFCET